MTAGEKNTCTGTVEKKKVYRYHAKCEKIEKGDAFFVGYVTHFGTLGLESFGTSVYIHAPMSLGINLWHIPHCCVK